MSTRNEILDFGYWNNSEVKKSKFVIKKKSFKIKIPELGIFLWRMLHDIYFHSIAVSTRVNIFPKLSIKDLHRFIRRFLFFLLLLRLLLLLRRFFLRLNLRRLLRLLRLLLFRLFTLCCLLLLRLTPLSAPREIKLTNDLILNRSIRIRDQYFTELW